MQPSTCSHRFRASASSLSASMGSITPCQNWGAEPIIPMVLSLMASTIAGMSARKSGPSGTRTTFMPR